MGELSSANAILAGLDPAESAALGAASQAVSLERGVVVAEANAAGPFVYFPVAGVLSLVGSTLGGGTVEVAVVGSEGAASVAAIMGTSLMPFRVVTQVSGRALRVPGDVVARVAGDCGDLHNRLLAYSHHLIAQVAQSAICNRFHSARERLARWLLMTADRAATFELPLTHEFIAHMVGGPRSAVSEAASDLRDSGAIDYRRGLIVIRDADELQRQSCECYEVLHADARSLAAGIA